jgi:hypothetical protein
MTPIVWMSHRIAIPPSLAGPRSPVGIAGTVVLTVRVRVILSALARVGNDFLSKRWDRYVRANVTAAAVKAMKSFQHEQTFTFDVPMADRTAARLLKVRTSLLEHCLDRLPER